MREKLKYTTLSIAMKDFVLKELSKYYDENKESIGLSFNRFCGDCIEKYLNAKLFIKNNFKNDD